MARAGGTPTNTPRAGRASDPITSPAAGSGGIAQETAGDAGSGGAGSLPQQQVRITAEPDDEAAVLFDQSMLHTYDIQIDPADLAAVDQQPSLEAWVPASLLFNGASYGPFMMRYKGAAGSFRYPCTTSEPNDPKSGKCSMKLGFNEVDPAATFFGLRKLNFHSMNTDASQLRDRLGYALFREHGLAAPRAAHARVLINGQLEGLFAVVEQIDGRFTRARFSEGGQGNVYKEIWPLHAEAQRYLDALETNEDEQPSMERILSFHRAIQSGESTLGAFMDVDYLARYIAVDRILVNDDGLFHFYCDTMSGRSWNHNYYWYEAVVGEQFWLIPWDMDYSFDGSPWVRLVPGWNETAPCECTPSMFGAQVPASCDPLVKQFTTLAEAYEREVDAFLAGPFAVERVMGKLQAWSDQIRPIVTEAAGVKYAPTEQDWASAVEQLKTTISVSREQRGTIH